MSYELFFKSSKSNPLDSEDFIEYFTERKNYEVTEENAVYHNKDTGVYFTFDFVDNEDDFNLLPITFYLNYCRPHIFGLEAALEVEALVDKFRLEISDPQINGMGKGAFTKEGFLSGWNCGNEMTYGIFITRNPDEVLTLPTAKIETCWRWNMTKENLQDQLGDDIFVPKIMFLKTSEKVFTTVVWNDGIPMVMPEVDTVLILRETILPKKFWSLGSKSDLVLADWSKIDPILQQFPLKQGALPYRLLQYTETPSSILTYLRRFKSSPDPMLLSMGDILNSEIVDRIKT